MRSSTSCLPAFGDPLPDASPARPRLVRVPFDRFPGWVRRYDEAHPDTTWHVETSRATADCPDGTRVVIDVPLAPLGEPTMAGLLAHLVSPRTFGVVLVRKGGFAVALLSDARVVASKVGRRHVQGRTKAGGWSQHRFARRRDNQARAAFDAAAEHVHRILGPAAGRLDLIGTGGDRTAVASVLAHPDLRPLAEVPTSWVGGVPDPTRAVLDAAVADVRSVEIHITDPS